MITLTKCEFTYCKTETESKTVAIIEAAGGSQRIGDTDLLFKPLGNVPVLARSIKAFEECDFVNGIVVVTKEESLLAVQQLCKDYNLKKVTDIVSGGSNRAESVIRGVVAAGNDADILLVHDGARPLVTKEIIKEVYNAAALFGAAVCAVPLDCTVKIVNPAGVIVETPKSNELCAAQTPQGFSAEKYRSAVNCFSGDLSDIDDDSMLLEAVGETVHTTNGSSENIKIAKPEDFLFAENVLKKRGENE